MHKKLLYVLSFLFVTHSLFAQTPVVPVSLTGTSYTETFDGLGSGLPTGWAVFTGATATTLGTSTSVVSATGTNTTWASTTGNFRNAASADGLIATTSTANQHSAPDRALAVRQTGSFGDPGAAFVLQLSNTTGFQNFQLSLKLQSLDAGSARITTWSVQYGIGSGPPTPSTPSSFTTIVTQPIGGTVIGFSNNTVTANFLGALDNIPNPIWIRVVALTASTGANNRPTTGLDDFTLTYLPSSVDLKPTVVSTSPASSATGVAPTANIGLIFSEPVTATTSSFSVVGSVSGAHTFALTGGPTSYTLDPDADFAYGETVTVTALASQIADQDGTPDNMAADYTYSFSIVPDLLPTVASTSPASSVTNVAPNANISLTFSEAVTAPASAFTLSGSTSGSHTFVLTGGPASYTLNPDADFTDGETVTVTALAAQIADQDGSPDNMAANYTYSFSIAPTVAVVKIHDIQGSGSTFNPSFGGSQSIEGIVTRTFAGPAKLNGFYVQEEDADADANPLTSEGIFVFDPSGLFTGNEGDKVKVTGTVLEFTSTSSGITSSLTELGSLVSVINEGASTMPTPTVVNLPVANVTDLEAYEGMLVTMGATTGNLAVTEYFQIGRYGQVTLSATGATDVSGTDARLDQYTQYYTPSVAGYAAYLAELAKRKIILDDGSGTQNLDPIVFGRGGMPLSATNTLRGGDEIASITTILDERFEGYRLQSSTGIDFIPTNVRPTSPPDVGAATLKVASANVLNFFVDLDLGASGTDYRGANTAQEFTRQRTKVIKNLIGLGADVYGIMELQRNHPGSITAAVQDLVAGLNAEPGSSGTYAFVDPAATGGSISSDAITVGIIYKTDKVTPVGNPASLTTSAAFDLVGRRPLAQTFSQNSNGGVFTLVVNHFKSKGSSAGGAGDADANDGQGASNGTRTRQAQDLAAWLATKPTGTNDPDYLVVGDLNAYAKEDPLTTLATAGYNNLLPATTYSYVFDGQVGALDHALGSANLATQVTGAEKWHINADEPSILDYNTEFKSAGQVTSLYSPDQFRSSDHDPVLIGLNLAPSPDLTALVSVNPSLQYGTTNCSVVVDVFDLTSAPTSGTLTVYVTKDPLVNLSFDPTSVLVGGKPVQNSDWTFNNTDPSVYILTTNAVIIGEGVKSFGLTGVLTPGSTKGSLSVSSIIVGGSGGEVKITNNSDADKIDYFDK